MIDVAKHEPDVGQASQLDPPGDPTAEAVAIALREAAEQGIEARQWLRAILPLLQLRSHEPDPSDRVQLAYDLMTIAACERVTRIIRSDLAPDKG